METANLTYQEKLLWIAEHNKRVKNTPEEVEKEIYKVVHESIIGWFLTEEEIANEIIRQIKLEENT